MAGAPLRFAPATHDFFNGLLGLARPCRPATRQVHASLADLPEVGYTPLCVDRVLLPAQTLAKLGRV